MSDRWQMNRMGFVNFWLYDEETFSFSDGKLLLRGQNGSGKSITTQSFIPFILDGDRTPSRLDPFGSSDRRMEYYFLGDGQREDATGYLFLEFKKGGLEQYRTIGIGQRAQKGKPMSFWGFVILDGRRIGYDLNLYKEAGSKKIPCTRQELKNLLGEGTPFTEAQREYQEMVNRYIFGFSDMEQYRQFIRLLIKVRAPKLSKEFKPTKVYEILNDSLQTLSDEDLRAMVEAMEKMDEIQSRLENLKNAFRELQIIRKEYVRYNLFMISKKARAYLAEKSAADGRREQLLERQDTLERYREEEAEKKEDAARLQGELQVLEGERETLHEENLEAYMERLESAGKNLRETEEELVRLNGKAQQLREEILACDRQLCELQANEELCRKELEEIREALEEADEDVEFSRHQETLSLEEAPDRRGTLRLLREELKGLEKQIEQGLQALREERELRERWDREEEKLQRLRTALDESEAQLKDAQAIEDSCRDALTESFYRYAAECEELSPGKAELSSIVRLIGNYQSPADSGELRELLNGLWQVRNRELTEKRLEAAKEKESRIKEREALKEEIRTLEEAGVPSPERKSRTEHARRLLAEQGIAFLPFYEAAEFPDGMQAKDRNRVEEQLASAGILDALVVAQGDYPRALSVLEGFSDVLLHPAGRAKEPYPWLTAAEAQPEIQRATEEILSHFSREAGEDAEVVLGENGYFRNGILEGFCSGEEEASYVGAASRKRFLERLLGEKREALKAAQEQVRVLEAREEALAGRLSRLNRELSEAPGFSELDQAVQIVRESEEELKKARMEAGEQEDAVQKCRYALKEKEQEVFAACRALPYMRNTKSYETAKEAAALYREKLTELEQALSALELEKSRQAHIRELMEKAEEAADEQFVYVRRAKQRKEELEAQIRSIREYLDNPEIKEKTEKLKKVKEALAQKQELLQKLAIALAVLEEKSETAKREMEVLEKEIEEKSQREKLLGGYFEEEWSLGLALGYENRPLWEAAKEAKDMMRDADRSRSGAEMTASLMKSFNAHRGALGGFGAEMEECFGGGGDALRARQRIFAVWNGKKLYLEEFYQVIREAIESTELLIQEEDRKLFEGILADTLSRKLSARIRESRAWIRDMSALMRSMDTSMALNFSLEWKPKRAEDENELDTQELERILSREKELLNPEEIEKVSAHFRTRIAVSRRLAEENGEEPNYLEWVREALDYRRWFEFCMYYHRGGENRRELTNGAFNRFSGGEKAMAMYVPLFAAVNAQYKKAQLLEHPRIIALDEAFAGVDDRNISSMFELLEQMDFDCILNSQVLWGCYETVKSLRIAELLRPANADMVTVIYYYWNGRKRVLDEQ